MLRGNVHHGIPESMHEELVQPMLRSGGLRIERILSQGQASPEGFWYDQEQHEFVLLVSGRAILEFEAERSTAAALTAARRVELGPGDWIVIEAHVRHRVQWTDPNSTCIWVAVFFGPECLREEK